jgi:hypothetical protein
MNGYINKENARFWVSENPQFTLASSLHPQTYTVWSVLLSISDIVTSNVYSSVLKDEFVPFLQGYSTAMKTVCVWEDGGDRPQTSYTLVQLLHNVSNARVLSKQYTLLSEEGLLWPPTSPALNLCSYFLWGYLTGMVSQKNLHTIKKLKIVFVRYWMFFYNNSGWDPAWFCCSCV